MTTRSDPLCTSAQVQPIRFLDLPFELRRQILRYTFPRVQFHGKEKEFNLSIKYEGKTKRYIIRPAGLYKSGSFVAQFWSSLCVSKQVRAEAFDFLFSTRRLALCCTLKEDLQWLQQPPRALLQRIRWLNIHLAAMRELSVLCKDDLKNHLAALLDFVAANLDAPRLFLVLTVGRSQIPEHHHAYRITIPPNHPWTELCEAVAKHLRFREGPEYKRFELRGRHFVEIHP